MALKVLAGDGEQIANTDTVVTSALAENVQAYLPIVDDGTGVTVQEGYACTVKVTGDGDVEVLDAKGARVGIVSRGETKVIAAVGDVSDGRYMEVEVAELFAQGAVLATNGAVAPTLSSTGPTGMTAASTGWARVQLQDGTEGLVAIWSA